MLSTLLLVDALQPATLYTEQWLGWRDQWNVATVA